MKIINCYNFMTKHFSICLFYELFNSESWCTPIHWCVCCAFTSLCTIPSKCVFSDEKKLLLINAIHMSWLVGFICRRGLYSVVINSFVIKLKQNERRHGITTYSFISIFVNPFIQIRIKRNCKYFDSLISLESLVISLPFEIVVHEVR